MNIGDSFITSLMKRIKILCYNKINIWRKSMKSSYLKILNQNKYAVLDIIIDVLFGGSSDKLKLLCKTLLKDGRVSDTVFIYNFDMFIRCGNFDMSQLRRFSEVLEEQGNKKSYAITIIKAIDDLDSEEKARCLANLTQSVINSQISVEKYLRLVHLLRHIIEIDLKFLSENICKGLFINNEYIDEYIISGIIREADGGYVYTEKAWDLVEYGILRGHDIKRPSNIEKRAVYSIGGGAYDGGDEG